MELPVRTLRSSVLRLLTDLRVLQVVGQVIFLILLVAVVSGIIDQIFSTLAERNLTPNFAFLQNRAGFEIAGAQNYTPNDSFGQAFWVGLQNTLSVVSLGLVGATILGVLVGVFLLSRNWLVRTISRVLVEILRNTPLLVQIIVVFFFVLALPPSSESLAFPQEGVLLLPLRFLAYAVALVIGVRLTYELAAADWQAALTLPLIGSAIAHLEWAFGALTPAGALALVLLVVILQRGGASIKFALMGALLGQGAGALIANANLLPDAALRVELYPLFYLNNRGFYFPTFEPTARFGEWALFVVLGVVFAALLLGYMGTPAASDGGRPQRGIVALAAVLAFAVGGWLIVSAQPLPTEIVVEQAGAPALIPLEEARAAGLLTPADELQYSAAPLRASVPEPRGLRYDGGGAVSRAYVALLIALVIYTAAFIAEVVRAGILAVPRGQLEAARALGLSSSQTLRMVILPQALRVIIPPLSNQYLNLSKNSSLAIAIAYPDIYAVMGTVITQSGQAVTGIVVIMLSYLVISLIIAASMNWINRRFEFVTR